MCIIVEELKDVSCESTRFEQEQNVFVKILYDKSFAHRQVDKTFAHLMEGPHTVKMMVNVDQLLRRVHKGVHSMHLNVVTPVLVGSVYPHVPQLSCSP